MIKEIIYGSRYARCVIHDKALSLFEIQEYISFENLHKHKCPTDMNSVFEHLQQEGMICIGEYGVNITEKGKMHQLSGGYVRQLLKERITFFSIIAGIIASLITVILVFL